MTVRVPCACPVCGVGVVVVNESAWTSPLGNHRSVWVDEPVRCGAGCALSEEKVRRLVGEVYERRAHQLPLVAPLSCTVCGAALGPGTRRFGASPLCAAQACRTVQERERRASDPAYRERVREKNRRWAQQLNERRALRTTASVCTGCGRSFPGGGLLRGVCGGPWCPSGAEWQDAAG